VDSICINLILVKRDNVTTMIFCCIHNDIFQLSSILLGIRDPFVPFENLFCALFLGGICDSLAKLLGYGQAKDEKADTKKTN